MKYIDWLMPQLAGSDPLPEIHAQKVEMRSDFSYFQVDHCRTRSSADSINRMLCFAFFGEARRATNDLLFTSRILLCRKKVDEISCATFLLCDLPPVWPSSCVTFLLCDPGWYVQRT